MLQLNWFLKKAPELQNQNVSINKNVVPVLWILAMALAWQIRVAEIISALCRGHASNQRPFSLADLQGLSASQMCRKTPDYSDILTKPLQNGSWHVCESPFTPHSMKGLPPTIKIYTFKQQIIPSHLFNGWLSSISLFFTCIVL